MKKEVKLTKKIKRFLKKLGYPKFLHRFGPKTYELWHHVNAFLLMEVFQLSLRRIEKILKLLGFKVPTYSALCKSRRKISLELWQKLLRLTAGLSSGEIGIDGTGFSKTNPSFHYLKRIEGVNPKRYTKLSTLFDLKTKKFLVMKVRANPRHDMQDVKYLLARISEMKKLYADRGYDSEEIHEYCYWKTVQTYIPPRKNIKKGWARKFQIKKWDKTEYNKRSNIEAGFSAIKRKYGSDVRAKKIEGQRVEIFSKGIAHNLNLMSM